MSNPYALQPTRAFWRPAVGDVNPMEISDLWRPKYPIGKHEPIATLGSCFAQHISRALMRAGYRWLDSEPPPSRFPEALFDDYHYRVFSARIGNVYTAALLNQWVRWAFGVEAPSDEIWEQNGRYYDPFRPNIEPNGFASRDEALLTRQATLGNLRRMFETCGVFIFTLGLTEAWLDTERRVVYPMCPGTVAGTFDAARHAFKNYAFNEIVADLSDVFDLVRQVNRGIRCLLTVSPVPLTATATDAHVLVATVHSKSILRAVAGQLAASRPNVDYFPSYEIVSAFPFKGAFYEPNMRSVSTFGVDFVMQQFFDGLTSVAPGDVRSPETAAVPPERGAPGPAARDEVCEDMILDAFRKLKP
ncbi:hypothetical protein WS62_12910 [Burkholderia sp. ABCPW 14]|uniref:GSCFA domain-containing protein n=1 Tax=Burkholderia sp. ABCPW 14 TaxID=1637860 RepID=UPI000770C886|nr:GSCFA domain-containing protein [Burkholderia sp. ABCPW 14]KVD70178.1 hypothetical protein WS62_12910 [Burkholderia sp. ABCPW 14]